LRVALKAESVRAIHIHGQYLPDAVLVFSGVEAPPKK
jgi:hypothetical protein